MSDLKVKPLRDNIVVEPVVEDKTTASGIVIPDTVSKEKPQKGKVVAVGMGGVDDNGKTIVMQVKVGDIVLHSKYAPTEFKVDSKEYLIMKESDVLAVITK